MFLGPRAFHGPELATPPAEAPATGDAFKATQAQWADLKVEPVQMIDFPRTADTDGKIATDDDLTTPVFSPYTGRVVQLFARAGDTVHRGDKLFAVQAAEFAQGQSDLISAIATLRTAQAQLTLAEGNERRQHELFLAHGAAQKDCSRRRPTWRTRAAASTPLRFPSPPSATASASLASRIRRSTRSRTPRMCAR